MTLANFVATLPKGTAIVQADECSFAVDLNEKLWRQALNVALGVNARSQYRVLTGGRCLRTSVVSLTIQPKGEDDGHHR